MLFFCAKEGGKSVSFSAKNLGNFILCAYFLVEKRVKLWKEKRFFFQKNLTEALATSRAEVIFFCFE
jgi:hypothetical protein